MDNELLIEKMVLKYNGRNETKLGKFKVRWLGPYKEMKVRHNGENKLATLDNRPIRDSMNELKLKVYQDRKETIVVNMLGYATSGDWTIERKSWMKIQ